MANIKEATGALILGGTGIAVVASGAAFAQETARIADLSNCFIDAQTMLQMSPQPSESPSPTMSPTPDGSFDVFVSPSFAPASPLIAENRLPLLSSGEVDPACYSFDFIYSLNYNPETDAVNKDQLLQIFNQHGPVILDYVNTAGGQMTMDEFIEWHSDVLNAAPEVNDLGRTVAQRIAVNVIDASKAFATNKPVADAEMIISTALLYYADTNVDFRNKKGKKLSPEKANEKMKELIKEYQEILNSILSAS